MNTSEILNRAADLIEERGWTSGSGWQHEDGGPLCIEGAILAAIGGSFEIGDHYTCPAYHAVKTYLRDKTDRAPFFWNDDLAHGRVTEAIDRGGVTLENLEAVRAEAEEWATAEVVATLRACAVIEASREQTPDGITAATKDAYDPWATWSVPCHLRAVKAEEADHA